MHPSRQRGKFEIDCQSHIGKRRPARSHIQSRTRDSSIDSRRKCKGIDRFRQRVPPSAMKTGVLVFNLGGPETLRDVKPFLYRLFSDPEIIRIKFTPLRKLIAYTIATLRRKKSEGYYAQTGGGSPIRRLTEDQARALEKELR